MDNIIQAKELAESVGINFKQFQSIAYPVVEKMVKNANVLEHISVDNVIQEIDDILYRARDIGLRAMGTIPKNSTVDYLENSGQLTEDQAYDTNIELAFSVKNDALKAVETSMAQIILALIKGS